MKLRFKSNMGYLGKGLSRNDYIAVVDWAGFEYFDGPLSLRDVSTVVLNVTKLVLQGSRMTAMRSDPSRSGLLPASTGP